MIDSLIKQQTAWSQGSSKYQKQKKCTRSEISINLSFYVYIIPKRNNYSSNSNKKKKENGYNLKIGHYKYISELSALYRYRSKR